ncbi:hypothetical protein FLAG1_10013 [Fusarium langsethiae]|uniref:Uncharacterized protein n=1 Tax=Fusarium langsethiae TaxID=179993 RepID=A0A0M9EPX2_FUSLA|nr:hypothetical protein FLAG1_10013 [Fusarium langsethiae]
MSWINRYPNLRTEDWGLLDFEPHPNEAFTISLNGGLCQSKDNSSPEIEPAVTQKTSRKVINGESNLEQWLAQISDMTRQQNTPTDQSTNNSSTINLILASQMSSLDELPFTQKAYSDIMSQMRIHGSIVRAINRNTQCTFSALPFVWSCGNSVIPSIVYNCRTAGSWEGDMALSVTFFPETLTTNAVWYGCDTKEHHTYGHDLTNANIITSRLTNFDGSYFHPLILPTMFAEFERERHVGLVRKYMTQSVQRINDLAYPNLHANDRSEIESPHLSTGRNDGDYELPEKLKAVLSYFRMTARTEEPARRATIQGAQNTHHARLPIEEKDAPEPAVVLWQNTSFLSNGLCNWQTQLRKILQQLQDLDDTKFGISTIENSQQVESKLVRLREVGFRIKTRILDLIDEYDEHIRQCNHITEGLRLATQLELNDIGHKDARTNQQIARVNLKVAQMTRLDSSLMRSIATLGMIFLPATFVSYRFFLHEAIVTIPHQHNMAPSWLEKFIVRADATPDPQRSTGSSTLQLYYTALPRHRRLIGIKGDTAPRYEVTRKAVLTIWGDKCYVKSVENDVEIATIDFHSLPPKTEVNFTERKHKIDIKGNMGPFRASGGLGELRWKPTGMVPNGKASWELRDEGNLVMSVSIDDQQVNGVIDLWKSHLGPDTVEELIVLGVSKIEEYKKTLRNAKVSLVSVASGGA